MQGCTSSRQPARGIGDDAVLDYHGPQQLSARHPTTASHTGAYRSRATDHWEVYLLDHPRGSAGAAERCGAATGVSGRMSMRHPVSRAARRAFWPSFPIASESW